MPDPTATPMIADRMAGLSGKVFDVCGKVGGARTVHPHVVVIELADECLLLPAYTSGHPEVEAYKAAAFPTFGLRPDQLSVELDNAVHVRFYDGRRGNVATWLVERVDRWPRSELAPLVPVGEMNDAGLLAILLTFARLIDAKPERFSRNLAKRVRSLVSALTPQAPSPSA